MKKHFIMLLVLCTLFQTFFGIPTMASDGVIEDTFEENINESLASINPDLIKAKSAVLMDATTGTVLYSKNPNEALPPASVTKIMTLLLVAEEMEKGNIKLDDRVLISAEAASMGGSQIFLKEGEEFTVLDLIKSTVIASANDAAYALAELVCGSESAFVDRMNQRAKKLNMVNTLFENVTGLDDDTEKHLTSANDIAIMSRELIKYEAIMQYAQCWQDSIRDGEFILTNTNRLVRYYKGCTGLKTGSTDKAGFCISASAKRDNMHLIAVVMGSETRDDRNNTARAMLDWGFANYKVYNEAESIIETLNVRKSPTKRVVVYSKEITFLTTKDNYSSIEKIYELPKYIEAPMKKEDVIGRVIYMLNGKEIASTDVIIKNDIAPLTPFSLFYMIFGTTLLGKNAE